MVRLSFVIYFCLLITTDSLVALVLSYSKVHSMPTSVEKDYYIWRFLSQPSTTSTEAKKIIKDVYRLNQKLKIAYKKKTGIYPPKPPKKYVPECLPPQKSCITKITSVAKLRWSQRVKAKEAVLRAKDKFAIWHSYKPAMRVYLFTVLPKSIRKKLDYYPSAQEWQEYTKQPRIEKMIKIIQKDKLPKLSLALLLAPSYKNQISENMLMKLGFNALKKGKNRVAGEYFSSAVKKAKHRDDADKALFWAWMATKDQRFLSRLSRSYDVNIYTLAARDFLRLKYPRVHTPKLPPRGVQPTVLTNPIEWAKLKRKIYSGKNDLKALANSYSSAEAVGIYSYILTKASRDKEQYFPMPYRDYLSALTIERQAILYAIARQESKFVPSSISRSFALGMMQIMPFLIDHIAKQKGEKIDYDEIFDPKKALEYANYHLDYLNKWLYHPLFVAYAYNAGIGYTKRLLKRKDIFRGGNRYEPWLSIEKVENAQANEYGKKVLTNYVIYMNLLGKPIRLTDLIYKLDKPRYTDKFR